MNLHWQIAGAEARRIDLSRVVVPVLASAAALTAGWLAASAPGLGVLLVGALVVSAAAVVYPGWVLGTGLFLSVVSPAVVGVAAFGPRLLVLAGLVCLARMASTRFSGFPKHASLILVLLALMIASVGLGSSPEAVGSFFACAAAVAIAAYVRAFRKSWATPFALTAVAFVVLSHLAGEFTATGERFAGVSGNPNRMTLGLLVAICFLLQAILLHRRLAARALTLILIVLAVRLVFLSGSAQGIVGFFAIGGAVCVFAARRLERGAAIALAVAVITIGILGLIASDFTQYLSADAMTLSNRTGIFASGVDAFLNKPILGSGEARVDYGAEERSTHNSIIAIAVASGIVGLALWLAILGRSLASSGRSLRGGNLAASAVIVVVVTQLVQQIEALPLTWGILTLFGIDDDREGSQ